MSTEDLPKPLFRKVARRLKVLGDPLRLELLTHLMSYGEMNVTHLIEICGQRQATVSKHLTLMAREGILERRKDGLNVYYDIKDDLTIHCIYTLLCRQYKNEAGITHNFYADVENETV